MRSGRFEQRDTENDDVTSDREDDDYIEECSSSSESLSSSEGENTISEVDINSDDELHIDVKTEENESPQSVELPVSRHTTRVCTRAQAHTLAHTQSRGRSNKRRRRQVAHALGSSRQRRKTRRPERLADWMMPLAQEADWSHQPQSYERGDEVVVVHISHIGAEQAEEARALRMEHKRRYSASGKHKAQKRKCPTCRFSVGPPFKVFSVPQSVTAQCPVCSEEKIVAANEVTLTCGHALCKACFDRIPTGVARH